MANRNGTKRHIVNVKMLGTFCRTDNYMRHLFLCFNHYLMVEFTYIPSWTFRKFTLQCHSNYYNINDLLYVQLKDCICCKPWSIIWN